MEDVRVSTALAYCELSYPEHIIHIRVISKHTVTTVQGITSRFKVNNPLHMERWLRTRSGSELLEEHLFALHALQSLFSILL
jgi:hypothetical protein